MTEHPLERSAFLAAIAAAPAVRPGDHTVLSPPGAVERLQRYVETDPTREAFLA